MIMGNDFVCCASELEFHGYRLYRSVTVTVTSVTILYTVLGVFSAPLISWVTSVMCYMSPV